MATAGAMTRSAVADDRTRLKTVLHVFLELPHPDTETVAFEKHEIVVALTEQGITHFKRDFLCLSESDIRSLTASGDPLSLISVRRLIMLLAFYHYSCIQATREVKIESLPRAAFDDFRTNLYDSNEPIRPWKTTIAKTTTSESELSIWKKSVRPNKADYKEFRDESLWIRSKEQFTTTLESHSLSHLVDESHVISDPDLDQAQRGWLYSVIQTAFKAPMAKTIVTKHIATKDTRAIWKEICEYYDSSMTSVLRSQQISSYLTSTRYHKLQWKGTQANFILHWVEQARIYNEVSTDKFTENQMVTFLNSCLSGTPNLSQVLTLHRTAKQAAGIKDAIKFPEYVTLLLDQAQVHDAGNTESTNSRSRQSVNTHEYIFEDNTSPSADYQIYQANVHDHETPIELLINKTEQEPKRPRVDFNTWKSLSNDDQLHWDKISDSGKSAILNYATKKSTNNQGILKTSDKKTRFASDVTKQRHVNSHEQFENPTPNEEHNSSGPTIEVSTHQLVPRAKEHNDFDDILTMATTKTTTASKPNAHLTINSIMSTPTANNPTDTFIKRPDFGLEAFMTKIKIGDYEYEVESDEGNDFDWANANFEPAPEYESFDYSRYREEPDTPTNVDLLDTPPPTFLVNRASLEEPSVEPEELPALETREDLIKFHEDPEASKQIPPRPDMRTLTKDDFEVEETADTPSEPNTQVFDYSAYASPEPNFDFNHYMRYEYQEDQPTVGVEESKDEPPPSLEMNFGMMKSPFDFVQKPSPTVSRIVPNADGSRFVFFKENEHVPQVETIRPSTPNLEALTIAQDTGLIPPNYMDDPTPFISDEAKFYKKPPTQTEPDSDAWTLASRRKPKKKNAPKSGICSLLSPKSYADVASSSSCSSNNTTPSPKGDTSNPNNPTPSSESPIRALDSFKDFRVAGSD